METLRETLKFMMALDYLHERAQERKSKQLSEMGTQSERSKAILQLGRQMVGRSLMALGQRLSGIGKRLLEEVETSII